MRPYIFVMLASLAAQAISSPAHYGTISKQYQGRNFGKAATPLPDDLVATTTLSSRSTTPSDCTPGWNYWLSDIDDYVVTTTVTVTASRSSLMTPDASKLSLDTGRTSQVLTTTFMPSASATTMSTSTPSAITDDSSTSSTRSQFSATTQLPALSIVSSECSKEPFNKTDMPNFFGFNVVNQKPVDPSNPQEAGTFKKPEDWQAAFALLKQNFPDINAVRMYSTTDGLETHLMNAMPAAQDHDLMVLVGVWSGTQARFDMEKQALNDVIVKHGCDRIAAISVGNEDLNQVNVNHFDSSDEEKDNVKQSVADMLLNQISQIRNMTRDLGCCTIPVTHTDTYNEFSNTSKPWVPDLIRACDQAAIVNIFPYWSQAQITESWQMIMTQSAQTLSQVQKFGKDVWLGETGWASSQPESIAPYNEHGTNMTQAQQYFSQVGCQILSGAGTGFYYVDWDEDAPYTQRPAFGLFDHNGQPRLANSNCSTFKPDMRLKDYKHLPGFMGVGGAR